MATITTYRHSPNTGSDPAGTLVDTEENPLVDGNFVVSIDTTGWPTGSYQLTVRRQDSVGGISAYSNALSITVEE